MTEGQGVLLTGATGALGPTLAAELLAGESNRTLHVLIRAGSTSVAERFNCWLDNVQAAINEQSRPLERWRDRVHAVEGNVGTDQFGLDTLAYEALAARTRIIVHAAADTRFLSSLDDQWNTNVQGTRRVIDFARRCRSLSRVIHVSTICTSGTRTGLIREEFLPEAPGFVNNYEMTKWQAERLALSADLPLAIARVSIVLGSHASGTVHRLGAFHHLLKWFGRGFVPVIPGTDQTLVDLVSTETVAQFLARAVAAAFTPGAIWNISAGARAAHLTELAEICFEQMYPGQVMQSLEQTGQPFIVSQDAFDCIRMGKTDSRQRVMRQAMDSINSFLPMLLYPRCYETTQAERLWGGPLPCPDWRETLRRVIQSCGLVDSRATRAPLKLAS